MNNKVAKMLRKMGKDDKKSKRLFYSFDSKTKGALRKAYKNTLNDNGVIV